MGIVWQCLLLRFLTSSCISPDLLVDEEWGRAGMKACARHREDRKSRSDRMARAVVGGLCVGGVGGQGVRNGSRRSTKKAMKATAAYSILT